MRSLGLVLSLSLLIAAPAQGHPPHFGFRSQEQCEIYLERWRTLLDNERMRAWRANEERFDLAYCEEAGGRFFAVLPW